MRRVTFFAAAFVIVATAALGPLPAPAFAQADNDMPCWMYDPIGYDCTSGGGGGGGCEVCVNCEAYDQCCRTPGPLDSSKGNSKCEYYRCDNGSPWGDSRCCKYTGADCVGHSW